MRRPMFALACTIGLALAQPAAAQSAADVVAQFNTAYNERDFDTFLATFSEDAVVVWEGLELRGHEAIARSYAREFAQATPRSRIIRQGRAGAGTIVLEQAFIFSDGSEECCTATVLTIEDGRIQRMVIEQDGMGSLARR